MKKCMIITAAGMSTRQNCNKLLISSCNETMIEKTINIFLKNNLDIFIVVGHQKELMAPILKHRFRNKIKIIENLNYKSGIASSLKAGISAAVENYEYYGFCNGDKPFIKTSTVESMIKYIDQKSPNILVPLYQDRSGHPTFFSKIYINDFKNIHGDLGGIAIIKKYPNSVTYLPVDDNGVTLDMDEYLEDD